jgi:adenylylsulfate kinase
LAFFVFFADVSSSIKALAVSINVIAIGLRRTISSELGFSKEDREKHARRVAYLSQLLSRNGVITIVALISPYRAFREYARNLIGDFVEVWVHCSLETCIKRDPKGLYKNASQGSITNMTGIQAPYEPPLSAEVKINTEKENPRECAERIIGFINNIMLK